MSTNWTMVNTGKQAVLNSKTGAAGGTTGLPQNWELHLWTSLSVRTNPRDQVIGDFTEATFTGYSIKALAAWGVAQYDAVNFLYYSLSAVCSFCNTGVAGQTISGFYITDNSLSVLIGYGTYATPIVVNPTQCLIEQLQLNEISEFNN